MRTNKIKTLLMIIVVLCVAGICLAQEKESLEAKLAKLKAATKTKQPTKKSCETDTTKKQVCKKKTLDERLAELEARYKGFQENGKVRDTRITSLESKLATLQAKLKLRQDDKALAKRVTQIEQKILALENQSKPAKAQGSSELSSFLLLWEYI